MDFELATVEPTLVWGLFTRGLGLIFFISFVSLAIQVIPLCGSQSGTPMRMRLAKVKADIPSWRRYLYFPTLLWINCSDTMLRGLTYVGAGASLLVIYGGPASFWALLTCWVCYLSLDMAMVLIFPWDCLLFESTLIALFLPATLALPSLEAVAAPAPAITWAYRILAFRLMFGFGKQKFLGSRNKDLAYLKGFLLNQPLPSPLAWYFQKLPTVALKGAVLFMFFAEIPAPLFAFFPGWLSIVFAVSTIALMIGIQAMGSFGYFSLVTIVLCITLFDNVTPRQLEITSMFSAGQPILTNAYITLHTLCACVAFLFNSWMGQSWHLWSFWYQLPRWVQPFITMLRCLHPLRWLHPYGVFPPNNTPAVKISVLTEVTWDRKNWHELEYAFSPCNEYSPPRFIAPYHPRADQAVIYDTFGMSPTSLIVGVLGAYDPYPFGSKSPTWTYCQLILRGGCRDVIKGKVLDEHPTPPVSVRITTIMLEAVSIEEHKKTGKWWKRTYIGPHTPPQELDPEYDTYQLADPELWHFDSIFWRRRSILKTMLDRAAQGREDPNELVLVNAPGITPADVQRFWSDFVPLISGENRETFDTLPEVRAELERRFDRREQRVMHRLLCRFGLVLISRLEPLYLHHGLHPKIPVRTYMELGMLTHYIVSHGYQALCGVYQAPETATNYAPAMTAQNGLYALSLFRLDEMTFEGQKLRLIDAYVYPHDPVLKQANTEKFRTRDLDKLTPIERTFARMGSAVSGYFNVLIYIREGFQGPRFHKGYPEMYPVFKELEEGDVVVDRDATNTPREQPPAEMGGMGSQPAE